MQVIRSDCASYLMTSTMLAHCTCTCTCFHKITLFCYTCFCLICPCTNANVPCGNVKKKGSSDTCHKTVCYKYLLYLFIIFSYIHEFNPLKLPNPINNMQLIYHRTGFFVRNPKMRSNFKESCENVKIKVYKNRSIRIRYNNS